MARHTTPLETVAVTVPEDAVEAFEAALLSACDAVGFFVDEETRIWRLEGVRPVGAKDVELTAEIALANAVSGLDVTVERTPTEADGWLARTYESFPEQLIGRRFAVRGTHLAEERKVPGRITLTLNAGVAFG